MNAKEILQSIINEFDVEKFIRFFRLKNSKFRFPSEDIAHIPAKDFTQGRKLAEGQLEDGEIIVCSFFVGENDNLPLTERSSKKAQYEVGKKVLKETQSDAGIFIFYDNHGNFRFSLIYTNYLGRRRDWSNFRRFTYFVSKEQTNKTFLQQIGEGDFSTLEKIKEAFSVEKVTEEFFEAYKYALRNVIIPELKDDNIVYDKKHSFAQQLLSRILFIYFLQRKGWFKWRNYVRDLNYIKNFWKKYNELLKQNKVNKDTFYSEWLCSLFFGAFNKKTNLINNNLPDEIKESLNLMPFLNGGLFSKNELDELNFSLPDAVFEWLFEPDESASDKNKGFLEIFNFTIDEASLDDADVAVDPEMLGKVYESLILEEERSGAGIFYTPRIEIDFMCRKSLVEYLKQTNIPVKKIIKFIFEPHNKEHKLTEEHKLKKEELAIIKNYLLNVRIVDPAVGSASFLVGMMNILVELYTELTKQLENREENIFALKQKIILDNLYGVDVKDWAVMVGELRLWLSLIIETDERYMDIYTKPLLPNLSFKIRQGDSLVQEIAGMPIYLRNEISGVPANIKTKLNELIDRKTAFFSSRRSADLKELKEIELFEQEIFEDIIQLKVEQLNKELTKLNNSRSELERPVKNLWGEKIQSDKEKLKNLKAQIDFTQQQIEKYNSLLKTIGSKTTKDYFLWELDFVEIFSLNYGFDIVIGNPPYVRQELIAPPLEHKQNYTDEQWRKLKSDYKEKLINAIKSTWEKDSIKLKIDKKSDLYVYFYYQSLSLLKPGGIFCFINSNSWLDVGYGAGLQEFLLKQMQPLAIIDNIAKRSFKQADVNTVIVFIKRPEDKLDDYTLRFIAFKKPFEEVINTNNLLDIENTTNPVFDHPDYRIYPKSKKELLTEGVEFPEEGNELNLQHNLESLPYIGNKWGGKYLRAPEIYFKILEKGKGKLVRLGDIAEVRFGIKTGANEFFYLKPVDKTVKEVVEIAEKNPQALIRVRNGAGWEGEIEAEYLKPVIKSPRELKTILVKIEDLNYLVFMCHKDKKELKNTKALEYIEWGERKKYQQRPTCKSRNLWWDLGEIVALILSKRFIDINHNYLFNTNNYFVGDTFFVISFYQKEASKMLISLNSILGAFFTEFIGRKNMGEGVLLMYGPEITNLFLVRPKWLTNNSNKLLNYIYKEDLTDIFTELGFDKTKPIREQEPNPLPDRKALDDIVFDALGLTEEELVKARLDKAKSV